MKHLIKIAISIIALWYTLVVGAQGDLPNISSLDSGWNAITTDGVCSAGTPYQFYSKPSADNSEAVSYTHLTLPTTPYV